MAPRKKSNNDDISRINQLLAMAWNANSASRILSIAEQILSINPDNVEALLLKADRVEDVNLRVKILLHAITAISKPENFTGEEDERNLVFVTLNHRLAYTFFVQENFNEALKYCEDAINFANDNEINMYDDDENGVMLAHLKALYYRILINNKDWRKILTLTMKDEGKSLARSYARLIAAWETAPKEKRQSICASIFWDALMMAPDVPFYILGFFEEPDDPAEREIMTDFDFAVMYYDTVSISNDLYSWFSRGTILFGLLSGRFENDEYDYMLDALDNFGGYLEYQRMRNIITSTEDTEVIETLAANKCLTE